MKILIESINCSYALLHIIIFQLKLFETIFWIRSRAKDDAIYRLEPCWVVLESKYLMLSETNCSKKKNNVLLICLWIWHDASDKYGTNKWSWESHKRVLYIIIHLSVLYIYPPAWPIPSLTCLRSSPTKLPPFFTIGSSL